MKNNLMIVGICLILSVNGFALGQLGASGKANIAASPEKINASLKFAEKRVGDFLGNKSSIRFSHNLSNIDGRWIVETKAINDQKMDVHSAIELTTDVITGDLVGYFAPNKMISKGRNISQQEALSIAKKFIDDQGSFPNKNIRFVNVFHGVTDNYWTVHWNHYINGTKAASDYINVGVRDDGEVIAYGKRWTTPDNVSVTPIITKEGAGEIALSSLKAKISQLNNSLNAELISKATFEILNNTYLSVSELNELSWEVTIQYSSLSSSKTSINPKLYYFTIDAQNGESIRIAESGSGGGFVYDFWSSGGYDYLTYMNNIQSIIQSRVSTFIDKKLYSLTDSQFLDQLTVPNTHQITFLLTHGQIVNPCSWPWQTPCPHTELQFGNTWLTPDEVNNRPYYPTGTADFIATGACSSGKLSDMSNAFINKVGFKAYMGMGSDQPNEILTASFFNRFFDYAINKGYNIINAKTQACILKGANACDPQSVVDPYPMIYFKNGLKNLQICGDNRGGDANLDLHVNYADLNILSAAYNTKRGGAGFNSAADFNKDGSVNYNDLVILSNNYEN